MSNYREHVCLTSLSVPETDEMGDRIKPDAAQCGICNRSWCDRCDPAPSALCHYCHGYGTSSAPIPPRQLRRLWRVLA